MAGPLSASLMYANPAVCYALPTPPEPPARSLLHADLGNSLLGTTAPHPLALQGAGLGTRDVQCWGGGSGLCVKILIEG